MANWSNTDIKFEGKADTVKFIMEQFEKHGYEIDKEFTCPKILNHMVSPTRNTTLSKKEWKEYAKECRRNYSKEKLNELVIDVITPKMAERYMKKYGALNWYDWNVKNWGTKWNANNQASLDIETDEDNNKILYISLLSPWVGAVVWFVRVCNKYNLSGVFIDYESDLDFFHKIVVKNEKIIEEIKANFLSDESIEELGVEYFLECYDGYFETKEDLDDRRNQYLIDEFVKHGYDKEKLAKYYGIE